jgi:hypothetical protein
MKKNLRNLVVCVSLLGFTTDLFALDIREQLGTVISPDAARELVASGRLQRTVYRQKNSGLNYLPQTKLGNAAAAFLNETGGALPFFSESLYLYAKRENRRGDVGADASDISVILRSVSHLEGLEYFSPSRKQMRTLYEKAYVIDNVVSRKRINDPVTGSADGLSVPVIQKDLTFGEYAYQFHYRHAGAEAAFFSENIDYLRYGIFKLIKPGNLRIALIVHDFGDYLFIYGLTGADFLAVPGIEPKLRDSFTARSDAMFDWFVSEYEKYN